MRINRRRAAVAGATLLSGVVAAGLGTAGMVSSASGAPTGVDGTQVVADLNPLNNSGVTGKAKVVVDGRKLHVKVNAHRLEAGLPHAQHIHFGKQALNECPNVEMDANGDFRLTTAEGQPAYGPVRVSLTERGDTSADSTLAVNRFPTAPDGHIHYERQTRTKQFVANGIKRGNAVVVIHGVDYNNNGEYDFRSAGRSELDPALPAEATDPATCGVLRLK